VTVALAGNTFFMTEFFPVLASAIEKCLFRS
jgi:hypothetical protein